MKVGNERLSSYYYQSGARCNYVNFHFGIHPIFFDMESASGILWEIGACV